MSVTDEYESPPMEKYQDVEPDLDPTTHSHGLENIETHGEHEHGAPAGLEKTMSAADRMSFPHEFIFVTVVCNAQLLTQVGLGQALAILYDIGRHYSLKNTELGWLVAGYSLTVGTFILIWGRFGDLFGHKRMLLAGFAWYGVWSLVAGFAYWSNHVLFVFARVFQGIGPSIMLPNSLAILGTTYSPGRRKNMVFSIFGACAPTGSIIGSLFAALCALTWWPWAFISLGIWLFILVAIGMAVIPACPLSEHMKEIQNKGLWAKFEALDPWGSLVGVTSLILFNFAWNQAPLVGWPEPYVYVTLILGLLLFPIFVYIELHVASAPLIPFRSLSTDVIFVLGCISCGWAAFGVWSYYIWSFLEVLRGSSPRLATAYISPVIISGSIAAVATGFLLDIIGPAWVMLCAMVAFTTGSILIMTAPVHQVYWGQIFMSAVIMPWGMDMSFPAGTLILSNSVAKRHQGIGASLVNTVVNYSISLGLGFAGTVEVQVNDGGETPANILKGFRGAMYTGCGLGALGIFVAIAYVVKSYVGRDAQEEKSKNPSKQAENEKTV